jgi:hypothetical protein
METVEEEVEIEQLILSYMDNVDRELAVRLEAWPPNFANIQVHEVIGGMLARQSTLAKEIASAPSLWSGHSAPILLRAMADAYINIAWLSLDPAPRCLKYIAYGLGQKKLELEHRRAEIGDREPTQEEQAMLDAGERWIDSQHACFLLDVDLGKWAGLSVRELAREADCLDFYNYVYTPYSACAHSMWHHIAGYNLSKCANPLHRFHRRPISPAAEPDIHYWLLAAKYWTKTLGTFDARTHTSVKTASSYEFLLAAFSVQDNTAQAD